MNGETRLFATLCLLSLVPAAASSPILTDPQGDAGIADPAAPSPPSEPADLLALSIEETSTHITFLLETAVAEDPARDADVDIYFSWSDSEFRVRTGTGGSEPAICRLYGRAIDAEFWGSSLAGELTERDGKITLCSFERQRVLDRIGRSPVTGEEFARVFVESEDGATAKYPVGGAPGPGDYVEIIDRMPDTGHGTYVLVAGGENRPAQFLASAAPIRYSNGEATAHVFPVTIINRGEPVNIRLDTSEVPDGWAVFAPHAGSVDDVLNVSVVAAVPFVHQHGETPVFSLDLYVEGEAAHSLPLGVHFFETPQPGGHHPTLFLHTTSQASASVLGGSGATGGFYMNTLGDDERDTNAPLAATGLGSETHVSSFSWKFRMDQSLKIGLDQDVESQGVFDVNIDSDESYTGTLTIRALVAAAAGDEDDARFSEQELWISTPAAIIAESQPVDAFEAPSGPAEIPLLPVLQHLEPSPGRSVWLDVALVLDEPVVRQASKPPFIQPGASATLPLRDFHQGVGDASTRLIVENAPQMRQPGATALFSWTLEGLAGDYDIQVPGTHADWTEVLTPKVRSGELVQVAVRAPPDAAPQTVRHFIVASGPSLALGELTLGIDASAPPDDDKKQVDNLGKTREAPMALAIVLVAIGVAATRRY